MKNFSVLFKWHPDRETIYSFLFFFLSILFNGIAHAFIGSAFFFLFYQGLFVLGVCILLPLWYMSKTNQPLASMGVTLSNWYKAVFYGVLFVCLSLFGRFMSI